MADEPLGLRPEMTASIVRASATRFAHKTRPLRLWSSGAVFKSKKLQARNPHSVNFFGHHNN